MKKNFSVEHLFPSFTLLRFCECVSVQFNHSVVSNSAIPWITAHQASLSITNSRRLLKLMSIELMTPSNHLVLYRPLLLPPSIFPSIRVFSSESALHIRWPKYWSFSFSMSPSNEYSGLISSPLGWTGCITLQSKGLWRVFSKTTVQPRQHIKKQRHYFANKVSSSQSYGFSSSHV